MQRNIYLKMKTLVEAREIMFKAFDLSDVLDIETMAVPDAVGRVLARPVEAVFSSPGFHSAAMDGIAVMAEATFGASEGNPKELVMGKNAFSVNTGHVLPENTDTVIMIEYVNDIGDGRVEIEAPAFPWQNVRKMGEDIVATELLFPRNHVITPYCVGALLSGGIFSVAVRQKPKVLVIPTGSELVDWENRDVPELAPGEVLDSNSYVLGGLARACGAEVVRHAKVPDDPEKIKQVVKAASDGGYQLIMTVGGSSAGSADYTRQVIDDLGEVLVHGVTIMPGKPVIIGKVNEKPVFGMPGYPVSTIVAFEQFAGPLISSMLGQPPISRAEIAVEPARKIASKLGVEEFLRVKLGTVGDRVVATPLPRGAGCITTITEAHGIIRVPNNMEGLKEGAPVTAELLCPLPAIKNTIVVVGSHDNTLDVMADEIKAGGHGHITLSSSHVGSMGGLMAIKKGVCHLAGSHLLDPSDGTYNISYIQKYLPDIKVKLVNLVDRDQGLMVAPGNPKNIKGIEDLSRDNISFVNRQAGSGTRVLLDFQLDRLGIDPGGIKGYENDEFTHMSVAVAVLSKTVDAGLGIYAAAKALGLDFIPVVTEQYDLVIPEHYFQTPNIQVLLDTINTADFKRRVEALGGYSTRRTGDIVFG